MKKTVNILGTEYEIKHLAFDEDSDFKERHWSGYCKSTIPIIVVGKLDTFPGMENETEEDIEIMEKQTLRHEIVHAFLNQCGLMGNSNVMQYGWAENEEMVDWFALQGQKIYEAWKEAGAL